MKESPVTIAYIVACCIYFAVSLVIVLVGKNTIPKKFIVISTVVSSLLFVVFSIYFWSGAGAKTEVRTAVMYCSALSVSVLLSIVIPSCLFCVKNAWLVFKNAINDNPQQKERIAVLIGYERLKKKGLITKQEYEQKENELFGFDD